MAAGKLSLVHLVFGKAVRIRHYPVTVSVESLNQVALATGMLVLGRLFKFAEAQSQETGQMPTRAVSASMGELESNLADVWLSARTLPVCFYPASRRGLALRQRRCMQSTHRNSVTLVLGGVRSGKSHYAQQFGERAREVVFVATAQAYDDEMRLKIDRHRENRPASWKTVEEPLELAKAVEAHGTSCDVMIVDCLTFFASNLLDARGDDHAAIENSVESLCTALRSAPCPVVLVSNEVGSGVVPAFASGRRFRDLLGEMNQRVARVASDVVLLVAGLPLVVKGEPGATS